MSYLSTFLLNQSLVVRSGFHDSANYFTILVIFILLCLALHIWHYRRERGALWQVYLQISKVLWLGVLLASSNSEGIHRKSLYLELGGVLSITVCYIWYRFIAELSGYDRRIPRSFEWMVRGTLGTIALLMLTNSWHRLLWDPIGIEHGIFHAPRTVGAMVLTALVYSLNGYTLWINVRWALENVGLRRVHAWAFLLPVAFTWTGQLSYRLLNLDNVAPCSLGFCLSGLTTIWAFHRWRIYSILPLAHESLIRDMDEGMMVVDTEGYIVDMNVPAGVLFSNPAVKVGSPLRSAERLWPELVSPAGEGATKVWEAKRRNGCLTDHYRITRTALSTSQGYVLGQVLVFRKINREKEQQQRLVEQERALAMLREREILGRELHDGQSQAWGSISQKAQWMRNLLSQKQYREADRELDHLIHAVQEIHTDFRESVYGLRNAAPTGLVHALETQLEWYRNQCDLDVNLIVRNECGPGMLSPTAESHLVRIVQEAMVNVRKSAHASRVQVVIACEGKHLLVRVEDDGCGFVLAEAEQLAGHHGLQVMQERANAMGGALSVISEPGKGTVVSVRVPVSS